MRTFLIVLSMLVATPVLAQDPGRILLRLQGSNTIGAELAPSLVVAWLKARGYRDVVLERTTAEESVVTATSSQGEAVAVPIKAHGSSTAFQALSEGSADIGMASRAIKEKEVAQLWRLGPMQGAESEFVLGLDGIAVIVHPDNTLTSLDKKTLGRIFSGEVSNWSELGGGNRAIRVYARDDKSGTFDTFKSLVLGKGKLTAGAQRFESNADLSDAVAADPQGIGFVGLPYVRAARALAVADDIPLAIAPGRFTVATEDYALARRLFLYLPLQANELARDLVAFAIGVSGQQLVAESGFVSQEIISGKPDSGVGHAEYYSLVRGAERLSLNFRFHQGSARLDNKARHDIQRLADYLAREENRRRELILVGFSDSNEAIPLHSLGLSIQRADGVANVLLGQGVVPRKVRGYGPAVTVASNQTLGGREKNRRVEVWLR